MTLKVYDVLGREIATLVNAELSSGSYDRTFDAHLLPSGIYFSRLAEGGLVKTSKMILVK